MKLLKYLFLIAAAAGSVACSMDRQFYSEREADGYVKDANSVNSLLIGTYGTMHNVLYYEWAMTELRTDNTRMRSANSTSSETKLIEQLDQSTILSAHSWVDNYWTAAYHTIANCNNVLANLGVVADEQLHDQYEGEARFLRALNYFNLVRLWGPVFKVTTKLTEAEAKCLQRAPSEEIYALIESDLEAIVDGLLLPEKQESTLNGRATLIAAKALLAKVYATHYVPGESQYNDAKTLLAEVLTAAGNPQSGAELVPYDQAFSIQNEMNREILFAIRYTAGNKGVGSPFGGLFGPSNNGGNVIMGSPKQYNFPSDDLLSVFKKNTADKRIAVSFSEKYWNKTTNTWVTAADKARHVCKFLSPVLTEYDGENDWPILRVGDMTLLYAEVLSELAGGPTADAVKYLNMTRERAGIATYTLADFGSLTQFRTALREERRMELAFENQRFYDLKRWGVLTQTINDFLLVKENSFYSKYGYIQAIEDWQTLLPIPLTVININPDVAQNVGY